MIGQEEENKIINETKFAKWLSDAGQDDSLDIPTKDIEEELRKVINLTKEKHDEKVHEDSHILYDLIWKETRKLREYDEYKEIENAVSVVSLDAKDCLSGIARRIEDYSERTDWKFIIEKNIVKKTFKEIDVFFTASWCQNETIITAKDMQYLTDNINEIKKRLLGDES